VTPIAITVMIDIDLKIVRKLFILKNPFAVNEKKVNRTIIM
jgi:hypothetical protein